MKIQNKKMCFTTQGEKKYGFVRMSHNIHPSVDNSNFQEIKSDLHGCKMVKLHIHWMHANEKKPRTKTIHKNDARFAKILFF